MSASSTRPGDWAVAEDPGPSAPDGPVPPPRRWGLVAVAFAAVVLLDQASKHWAVNRLVDGDIDLIGSLRLRLAFNPGAAFSFGAGNERWGLIVTVLAPIVLVVLLRSSATRSPAGAVAVGLVAGGALGNLADRAFRGDGFMDGHVVDFIDLQWWPVFNVADVAVVAGAILLVLVGFREPTPAAGAASSVAEPDG